MFYHEGGIKNRPVRLVIQKASKDAINIVSFRFSYIQSLRGSLNERRGCLNERRDGIKNGTGRYLSRLQRLFKWDAGQGWKRVRRLLSYLHLKKNRWDNFWQRNIKDFILKNGAHKCKQYTQKLADNCIKYIDLKFLAGMTSFLLAVKFTQCDNTILLSLFQAMKDFEWKCIKVKRAEMGKLTYWRASRGEPSEKSIRM